MSPEAGYRHALVTGASSGIGRALTKALAARGVRVFAAARRKELLEGLRDELGSDQVVPLVLDVTEPEATREAIARADEGCGGLDLVVANAGIGPHTPAQRLRWKDVEDVVRVNVLGAAATLTAVLGPMVERRRGHLVGISSLAGYRGLPGFAAYSGSKAFLSTFLESLRLDLRRKGVKVTTVSPGFVRTEINLQRRAPMPMAVEVDDAAERIASAIYRGARSYAFPWPMALATGFARTLPDFLYDASVGRFA